MQLEPLKYNQGMISAFKTVVQEEGLGVLATGTSITHFSSYGR